MFFIILPCTICTELHNMAHTICLCLLVFIYHFKYEIHGLSILSDSLQFELLNVLESISNKMLFKSVFLIIYVLDEF